MEYLDLPTTDRLVDPEILAEQKRLGAAKHKGGQKALLAELERIKREKGGRGEGASPSNSRALPKR